MPSSLAALLTAAGLPFLRQVPLADKTTLKVGGPADFWLEPDSTDALATACRCAREAGVPLTLLGNGSNLLVRDGGIPGLTVCLGPAFSSIHIEGDTLHAQAGARMAQLAVAAQAAGLSGLEPISGIPGTLGGALCMNAGSYGREIGQLVLSADILEPDGTVTTLSREAMDFAYRHSALTGTGRIALGASLRLTPGDPDAIRDAMRGFATQRREKQPLSLPSAGSFFKRPQGHFAAALIDQAGLKGLSVGGAQVSQMHAGFLVNTGGATAADFLELMARVQARVFELSGVMLEPEVQIIGCDSFC